MVLCCVSSGVLLFFFSSRRRHTRLRISDWSSDVCSSDLRAGFSDADIGTLGDRLPEQVRQMRREWAVLPVYKTVDTCAAEFEAETPYFYSTQIGSASCRERVCQYV